MGSNNRWYFVVNGGARMQLDIPLNFTAGSKYKVGVKALAASESDAINVMSCYRVTGEGIAHFTAGARRCYFICIVLYTGDRA